MYALKTPAFLRPASRPTSPVPGPTSRPDTPNERARPMSKLSLSNFKRTASPMTHSTSALIHDGSYMEVLSLRLSEAISRAVAQPPGPGVPSELLSGRRPIPAGRGHALGELIASEIKPTRENPHLYRAVIRTLHRPLSVLVTNLSGQLLPLIASPAFASVPSPQSPNLNPTQHHALAIATFAGELLETFDGLGLGRDAEMRGDGLKGIRDSLVTTIKRVVEPLVAGIKNDLMPRIEELEQHPPPAVRGPGATKTATVHPTIAYLQNVMPVYARVLGRYITSSVAEDFLASFTITLVWRGLVALSNRPSPAASTTPPGSPPMGAPKAIKDNKRRGSTSTPPTTPPPSRFTLKLPPSRPPSPLSNNKVPGVVTDARALYDLFSPIPRPSKELAREAVQDAFDSLSALVALLEFTYFHKVDAGNLASFEAELDALTDDLSVLIALPILLRAYVFPPASDRTISRMLGISEAAYRTSWLSGFARAEECVPAVGQRVLNILRTMDGCEPGKEVVMRWLQREVIEATAEQH
ncbi:uncharacterized protein PHACADRAFT_257958 [Phanerochaete carnosa HHB-10118-sp]|uniref:Uncharacterized protein n=1 Tax=Phanerochaete carnosa (strain HHB-10118-sp) TaxID=650164 RepID=K5W534_PHACS|nr:uncharacterized protein PHACADRAFT_257958 [Phanerochaete carnosa HHB-10118-sp]EKM54245.1 hypothetical protein PHACADRAFT_257958 [Phanerochaete carnosa HHB-10118-sp]